MTLRIKVELELSKQDVHQINKSLDGFEAAAHAWLCYLDTS